MAVYTEVADEELEAFLEPYGIGQLLSYKGIAEGVENSNFMLHTDKGTYFLTLYEKRVAEKDLPFFLGLMNHLADKGIACPVPLRNKNGEMLGRLADRPAALITFLEGVSVKRPQPKHCAELGRALAKFHLGGRDFDLKRENALSVSGWRHLFKECHARADEVAAGLSAEIENELSHLEANWPKALPQGVIHADMFPDNVFFIDDAVSGVIDFYFACTDAFAYDLGILLNAWCFEADSSLNITKARLLLSAYDAARPLSDAEKAALPMLARGSAMRFLLTRLYDWLNHPEGAFVKPKDPMEYVRRLRFHAHVRDANEYGLRG